MIRLAVPDDATQLAELAKRTFHDTFATSNDPAAMAVHLARSYNPHLQLSEINDLGIRSLIASVHDVPVAYTQLRPSCAALRPPECVTDTQACEIWRFYVDQSWHGHGVAQQLMAAALDEARALGASTVWLGVWERNPRAIAFYQKCGFSLVGDHEFLFANERQTDLVMTRAL